MGGEIWSQVRYLSSFCSLHFWWVKDGGKFPFWGLQECLPSSRRTQALAFIYTVYAATRSGENSTAYFLTHFDPIFFTQDKRDTWYKDPSKLNKIHHTPRRKQIFILTLLFQPKLCITPLLRQVICSTNHQVTRPPPKKTSIANVFASGDVYLDGHFLR